jgi:hypothetical protein
MGVPMVCRLSLMLFLSACLCAQQLEEYSVKAAFLYNFAKFVDWPAEAFRSPGEPFSICVLGEDPFGRALDDVTAGKTIDGRSVTVRRITDARQTGGCQILFVSASADKHVLSVFTGAKQRGLLTVGDAGSSTSEGVIITFTMESGKVRFEINAAAADRTGLRISAKLMSLAQIRKK